MNTIPKFQWPLGITPTLEWCFAGCLRNYLTEKTRQAKKRYKARHPERFREHGRNYRNSNRKVNPEKWRARDRRNYAANRAQKLEYKRIHHKAIRARKAGWLADPKVKAARRMVDLKRYHEKLKFDPQFKLRLYTRNRLQRLWKEKSAKTGEVVGCTWDELEAHLESKFQRGMNWSNHNRHGWHIDHIIPCSKFDMTDERQVRQCFHWTNLAPTWAKDNLSKNNRISHKYGNTQPLLTL